MTSTARKDVSRNPTDPIPHSPAPWRIEPGRFGEVRIVDADGFPVATIAPPRANLSDKNGILAAEAIGNALLISAGPSLHDALSAIHDLCEELLPDAGKAGVHIDAGAVLRRILSHAVPALQSAREGL